jgi:hypothetical protein
LSGVTTPYDYLAIELEPNKGLREAHEIAGRRLRTRTFRGGFRQHISLLKFAKGSLSAGQKVRLVRELNASLYAARAIGRLPVWEVEGIAVSSATREIFYTRPIGAA